MTYNDIMECIERETNEDGGALWRFHDIIGHEKLNGKQWKLNPKIGKRFNRSATSYTGI